MCRDLPRDLPSCARAVVYRQTVKVLESNTSWLVCALWSLYFHLCTLASLFSPRRPLFLHASTPRSTLHESLVHVIPFWRGIFFGYLFDMEKVSARMGAAREAHMTWAAGKTRLNVSNAIHF